MTKYINTIVTIMLSFFITLILNAGVQYYFSEKGTISISDTMRINKQDYKIVTLQNYTDNIVDGLLIKTSKEIKMSSIFASEPIELIESKGAETSGMKYLQISKIPPRSITRLNILVDKAENKAIYPVNIESVGFKFLSESSLELPIRRAVYNALITAIIYAILFGLFINHDERERKKLRDEVASVTKEWQARLDSLHKKLRDDCNYYAKMKLLLLARINDYSKELSFWRNTIRQIASNKGKMKGADELFKKVTESLETYGTKPNLFDFEAIKVASAWINETEKTRKTKPKAD